MRISVALCTYNGSRFLRQQLQSIGAQSRRPDEIVIVDDKSTDETVKIATEFADNAPFSVLISVNESNVGSTDNFQKAIGYCTGDIVVLSDQDDVWLPQKLGRLETTFSSDEKIGLVFTNAELTDDQLRPIGINLWRETFRPRDRVAFADGNASQVLLQYNVVTGATMAFRKSLKEMILPIPVLPSFIHDAWITLIASMSSRIVPIPDKLILYRQHSMQQLGAGLSRWDISRSERYRLTIEDRQIAIRRLEILGRMIDGVFLAKLRALAPEPSLVPDADTFNNMLKTARSSIVEHIAHISARKSLRDMRLSRLPDVLREMNSGRYGRFSRGWQSAALDLIRR